MIRMYGDLTGLPIGSPGAYTYSNSSSSSTKTSPPLAQPANRAGPNASNRQNRAARPDLSVPFGLLRNTES